MAGVLLDTHWKVMARMAGRHDLADRDDFATIPGRMGHREECDAMFAEWCAARTVEEAVDECAKDRNRMREGENLRGGGAMPAYSRARHAASRLRRKTASSRRSPGPAAKFSRTPTRIRSGAPALGAHTDEILAELGIDGDARKRLRESGVV